MAKTPSHDPKVIAIGKGSRKSGGSNGGYKPRPPASGKAAVDELVTAAGGASAAAAAIRLRQKSSLQVYSDADAPQHAPADVIEALTRLTRNPAYAAFLGTLTGHVLIPATAESGGCLHAMSARLSRQQGEVLATMIEALRGDGVVCAKEAQQAWPQVLALVQAGGEVLALLRDIIDAEGECPG